MGSHSRTSTDQHLNNNTLYYNTQNTMHCNTYNQGNETYVTLTALMRLLSLNIITGTIACKINVTPKGVYLSISKLHSILAVANLLAHNNKSQIVTAVKFHYRVLQLTAVFLTPLGVAFILLAMVQWHDKYLSLFCRRSSFLTTLEEPSSFSFSSSLSSRYLQGQGQR